MSSENGYSRHVRRSAAEHPARDHTEVSTPSSDVFLEGPENHADTAPRVHPFPGEEIANQPDLIDAEPMPLEPSSVGVQVSGWYPGHSGPWSDMSHNGSADTADGVGAYHGAWVDRHAQPETGTPTESNVSSQQAVGRNEHILPDYAVVGHVALCAYRDVIFYGCAMSHREPDRHALMNNHVVPDRYHGVRARRLWGFVGPHTLAAGHSDHRSRHDDDIGAKRHVPIDRGVGSDSALAPDVNGGSHNTAGEYRAIPSDGCTFGYISSGKSSRVA